MDSPDNTARSDLQIGAELKQGGLYPQVERFKVSTCSLETALGTKLCAPIISPWSASKTKQQGELQLSPEMGRQPGCKDLPTRQALRDITWKRSTDLSIPDGVWTRQQIRCSLPMFDTSHVTSVPRDVETALSMCRSLAEKSLAVLRAHALRTPPCKTYYLDANMLRRWRFEKSMQDRVWLSSRDLVLHLSNRVGDGWRPTNTNFILRRLPVCGPRICNISMCEPLFVDVCGNERQQ